jgi:hypothetical protein
MVDSKEEKTASRLNEAKSEIWLNLIRTMLDCTHSCVLNEYPPQTEGPDGVRPFLRSALINYPPPLRGPPSFRRRL